MQRLTEAVKHLLIVNVIIYFGANILLGSEQKAIITLGLFYPSSEYFHMYQLITHMFMHAGIGHLFFNMMALFFLGPPVEMRLGTKGFLILYLCAGVGAMLLHLLMIWIYNGNPGIPVVGASGAIFGVAVGFMFLYPDAKLMLLIPPIPVKAKILIPILFAIDIIVGVSGINSPIAHFAHVGGAIAGFLLLYFWTRKSRQ